MKLTYIGSLYW